MSWICKSWIIDAYNKNKFSIIASANNLSFFLDLPEKSKKSSLVIIKAAKFCSEHF